MLPSGIIRYDDFLVSCSSISQTKCCETAVLMLNVLLSEKLMTSLALEFPFTFLKILSRSPPSALLNGVSRRPVCGRTKISGQRGERAERNCYLSFSAGGKKHPSELRRNNIRVGAVRAVGAVGAGSAGDAALRLAQ